MDEAASLAADRGPGFLRRRGSRGAGGAARVILDALISAEDPPVGPGRLHDLSRSPDRRLWLLRELQETVS
jgi:hypothetical protein